MQIFIQILKMGLGICSKYFDFINKSQLMDAGRAKEAHERLKEAQQRLVAAEQSGRMAKKDYKKIAKKSKYNRDNQ